MKIRIIPLLTVLIVVLAACGPPPPPSNAPPVNSNQPQATNDPSLIPATAEQATADTFYHSSDAPHHSDVDLAHLELGNGKAATSPQVGYVYSCMPFNNVGATANGSWFNNDGTWDATKKLTVDGAVTWPHSFAVSIQGNQRVFTSNDLPNHVTGNFPISPSDDAYQFDRNPGSIEAQSVTLSLPASPIVAAQPSCLGGEVGIMLSGVLIFSAFDADGRDAPANEVQDDCDGHPQNTGFYHYHNLSDCLEDNTSGHSALMGYAFDGFGIYGYYGEDGAEVTNEDLDECHGHTHVIEWDGQMVEMYHYHATHEFPYVVGCFKGTPSVNGGLSSGSGQPGPGQPAGQPPQEAINACIGLSQRASCSIGPRTGTCQMPPNSSQLACVPAGGPP